MLGCVVADMIALRYLSSSIMTEKLARRGLRVPEEYEAAVLKMVRVGDVMRSDIKPVSSNMTVAELAKQISGAGSIHFQHGLPIEGNNGLLAGIITQGDLLRALDRDVDGRMTVLEAGVPNPVVAYPDEFVLDALHRMIDRDIGRMPVVARENPLQMVGYLNRASVLNAWTRQLEEERIREHGWLRKWRTAPPVPPKPFL